jgi:beta-glucosidase
MTAPSDTREPTPTARSDFRFPEEFLWGAATSAYQIEGSPLADGAGPSNWHVFSHTPGRTHGGDTGDVAADHYRRYAEDVAIMRRLGLNAYRFSISWSRIVPAGRGPVNRAGIDFYSRLVDLLLENGIQPCVTLYHWDLPAALDDAGGWLNRDIAGWFGDYARTVFRALGGRVPMWATINEPWVVADAGYMHGVHAPGRRSAAEAAVAAHNLLRAHGTAVEVFRAERGGRDAGDASGESGGARRESESEHERIGLVVNLEPKDPASNAPEDLAATERADIYMNRQYLDPVFFGRPPDGLPEIFGAAWTRFPDEDFRLIRQPIDFLGINYYTRGVMRHDPADVPARASRVHQTASVYTETGWEVHPESFTRVLAWVRERYGAIPLYVTENGAAFADVGTPAGDLVNDPLRVEYLRGHLRAAHAAVQRGVDLRGYFVWSLLDNFEWGEGYSKRFGIVHVDYATQRRTPKASAQFYRDVVRSRGAALTTTR